MITVNNIKSADWSLSVDKPGEVVEELADIGQCIFVIVKTQKGTDPLRLEFGIDLLSYLDRPVNQMVPGLTKEIAEGVGIWETRAIITRISSKVAQENVTFTIKWQTSSGQEGETVVNYGR